MYVFRFSVITIITVSSTCSVFLFCSVSSVRDISQFQSVRNFAQCIIGFIFEHFFSFYKNFLVALPQTAFWPQKALPIQSQWPKAVTSLLRLIRHTTEWLGSWQSWTFWEKSSAMWHVIFSVTHQRNFHAFVKILCSQMEDPLQPISYIVWSPKSAL